MNEVPQVDTRQAAETPTSIHLTSVDQIDLLCDAFEEAWLRGESPRIEMYLERCDEPVRQHLLAELLLVERELRIRQGESASRLDYQRRFPEYSTIIDNLEFTTIDERVRRRSEALDSSALPFAGTKLAHFELLEELGSGASGTVWKAKDSRLRRTVAIKIPHQGSLTDSERERFLREGQACAQLQHPNIVAVYEVGEDRGQLFIVAELVDGLNLKDWLKQRQPKPRETAELAAQVAEALHHAHEQGVIHRDLKPANVLMDRDGRPHITDFGLAKWSTDTALMTVEGNILGTPAYMSPEQARGDVAHVDRRSDVYGLGALLYEILAGQPPFTGEVAAIVHQVINDEPRPPRTTLPSIPRDLETICLKAMEKEPNRRYPSAQEMAVDLHRFLRGETILARRIGAFERSWRCFRRRPTAAALLALAAVVLLATIAITSLVKKNVALEGYQWVRIVTEPPGAYVALVPIDETTGETRLDPSLVARPSNPTPTTVRLKPGSYFVEAVLRHPGIDTRQPDFAEVYRCVPDAHMTPITLSHLRWRYDGATNLVNLPTIKIPRTSEIVAHMTPVLVPEELRRKNPRLPRRLFIDAYTTDATQYESSGDKPRWVGRTVNGDLQIPFDYAVNRAEALGKRLPTDSEYDAILRQYSPNESITSGDAQPRAPITDGIPEWTMTKYGHAGKLPQKALIAADLMIVRGTGNLANVPFFAKTADGKLLCPRIGDGPMIGFRGVRSGEPRFISLPPQSKGYFFSQTIPSR